MTLVMIVGLAMTAITLAFAGRRVAWLYRLITSGQPAPDRIEGVTRRIGLAVKTQLVEVFGQKKLLKWSVPGAAHFFVFWAFLILGTVYLEAYGVLISRNPEWHIPVIGTWDLLGFAQDLIAVLALVSLVLFAQIRLRESPEKLGRRSRFSGSHLGGAWLVLFMIFNVIWTMFFFRGAAAAADNLPYGNGAFMSQAVGKLFDGFSHDTLEVLEGVGLLLHIGIMLVFLIDVLHSKHLHIFLAPLNVLFGRRPMALGSLKPLMSDGKAITLDDVDDLDEDSRLGVGAVEDLTWKGMLDLTTCTECGRCQDQCPAWNTEKPLSPKMVILNLRDHAMAKAPYLMADEAGRQGLSDTVVAEAERPLVGETEGWAWQPEGGAVIDNDVLWSCVTCGACVNQCPVDIEHVDHIVDMRRYQVLVESNFPAELNQLFKGMENKGNPWNMSATARMDWAKDLPFDVKQVGKDIEDLDSVDWLFWVGCAGAYEDRAKKTTRAVAELLDLAGVSFGVLGNGETCTGDSARRAGNEFLFQGLAQQNVETFKEFKVKKVVSTCAHCFNTLKNEYQEFGIELEVVHHTQLLNRLVREGKLTPVKDGAGAAKRSITYHDPCYLGRHNQVYSPPRELLEILPGAEYVEMERNSERSFCCGAGGARMWMEETIGERINTNRTKEAVGTGADQIAVGCPFCRVMLADGLTEEQSNGNAREEVEVLDVAQMLLASVKGEAATRARPAAAAAGAAAAGAGAASATAVVTKDEPDTADAGPAAKASGGSSLFDTPADTIEEKPAQADSTSLFDTPADTVADEKPAEAKASGGSLFDVPADQPSGKPAQPPAEDPGTGGSLFDIAAPAEDKAEAPADAETAAEPPAGAPAEETPAAPSAPEPAADLGSGGSLFDIQSPEPATPAAQAAPEATTEAAAPEEPAAATAAPEAGPAPASSIPESGSLFDIEAPAADSATPAGTPEAAPEADEGPAEEPEETEEAEESERPEAGDSTDEGPAKPASSGASHQPKTDVDINQGGSLFDL